MRTIYPMGKARDIFLKKHIPVAQDRAALKRMSPWQRIYDCISKIGTADPISRPLMLRLFLEEIKTEEHKEALNLLQQETRPSEEDRQLLEILELFMYNPSLIQVTHLKPFLHRRAPYSYLNIKREEHLSTLRELKTSYYTGRPLAHDFEYDMLKSVLTIRELRAESKYLRPESYQHEQDLFRYENNIPLVYTSESLFRRENMKNGKQLYLPNIDGIPLTLEYINGVFTRATSQPHSEGTEGKDFTQLVFRTRGVPSMLNSPETITIRASLTMSSDHFRKINNDRARDAKTHTPTCKTLLLSILHQDQNLKQIEPLLQVYVIPDIRDKSKKSIEEIEKLSKLGLQPIGEGYLDTQYNDALKRSSPRNFMSNGLEIRFDGYDQLCDNAIRASSIILKSTPRFRIMEVNDIVPQISKSELIYTVLHCSTDKITQSFVFNSISEVRKLGVQKGSKIIGCELQGGPLILPFGRLPEKLGELAPWTVCPCCSGPVKVKTDELDSSNVMLYCFSRYHCKLFTPEAFERFCSPQGFNFSKQVREIFLKLIENDVIYHLSDIFSVKVTTADFPEAELFHRSIKAASTIRLENFLYATTELTYNKCVELTMTYGNIENYLGAQADFAQTAKAYQEKGVSIIGIREDIYRLHNLSGKGITKEAYKEVEQKIEEHASPSSSPLVPRITDREYDMLIEVRTRILDKHPQWEALDVGKKRDMLPIRDPIVTLRKTDDINVVKRWLEKQQRVVVEKKLDGIGCYLVYKHGELVSATTKRTEQLSKDILGQVKKIENFPLTIKNTAAELSIRGELYVTKSGLLKLNQARKKEGKTPFHSGMAAMVAFSNSGTMGELSGLIGFQGYMLEIDGQQIFPQNKAISQLQEMGLGGKVSNFSRTFRDTGGIINYLSDIASRKEECDVEIDGLVLKSETPPEKGKPDMIGYKFPIWTAITTIREVRDTSISVDPVEFEDTMVCSIPFSESGSKAKKLITVGSKVRVSYSPRSTPTFEVLEKGEKEFEQPREVVRMHTQTIYTYCQSLGIDIAKHQIEMMIDREIVLNVFDLYRLNIDSLISIGLGIAESRLIINAIASSAHHDAAKHISAWKAAFRDSDLKWLTIVDIRKLSGADLMQTLEAILLEAEQESMPPKVISFLRSFLEENKPSIETFMVFIRRNSASEEGLQRGSQDADNWKNEHEQMLKSCETLVVSLSLHLSRGRELSKQQPDLLPRVQAANRLYTQLLKTLRTN